MSTKWPFFSTVHWPKKNLRTEQKQKKSANQNLIWLRIGLSIPKNLYFDAPHGHISSKIDTKVKLAKKIRKHSKKKKNPPASCQKSDRTSEMNLAHSKTFDLIPLLAILWIKLTQKWNWPKNPQVQQKIHQPVRKNRIGPRKWIQHTQLPIIWYPTWP